MNKRTEIILVSSSFLVAFVLRVGWPALTEFKYDEALLLARSLDVAAGTSFHVRGISSSVGLPNFPLNVWLYALPLLAWPHVYAATIFTGLVNVLAVIGGWWLARRYWGAEAALVAALLFAVSPWSIFHARKIWAQNLLAPLVVGWAIGAVLALAERRGRAILLHVICLAAAVQVHLAALALIPASALLLLVYRRRVVWRWLWLGLGLGALPAVPFLVFLWRNGALERAFAGAGSRIGGGFSPESWRYAWLLLTGREIHGPAGPEAFAAYLGTVPDLTVVHLFWLGLTVAGLWLLAQTWWRGRHGDDPAASASLIVLVWCLLPPLFFMWQLAPVVLHYILPFYPAPYIAAGVAVARLVAWRPRWRGPVWGVVGASTVAQVWVWLALLFFLGRTNTPGGFGTPVGIHLDAVERAQTVLASHNLAEIVVAAGGETADAEEFAAIYDTLLRGTPHRLVQVDASALFPAGGAVVILTRPGAAAAVYQANAVQIDRVARRDGAAAIEVLVIDSNRPAPAIPLLIPVTFANGARLLGHDPLEPAGDDQQSWRLYWQPGAAPPDPAYNFFNHLLAPDGARLSQADGPAFAPAQWRADDLVLSFFWLPTPATAAASARVGMYTYPELVTVPVVDLAGNPAGDWVDLSLTNE